MITGRKCKVYITENQNFMDLRTHFKKLWRKKKSDIVASENNIEVF